MREARARCLPSEPDKTTSRPQKAGQRATRSAVAHPHMPACVGMLSSPPKLIGSRCKSTPPAVYLPNRHLQIRMPLRHFSLPFCGTKVGGFVVLIVLKCFVDPPSSLHGSPFKIGASCRIIERTRMLGG